VSELRSRFLATERLAVAVSATFSLVSLALAIVGIHGLLAQLVSQRTREIGIRMALGADRRRINAAIVLSGLRLTLLGVTAGLVAVAVGWRAIAVWLPQVDRPSIGMQGLNACVLVVVTVIAAWAPARRASAVDPVTVLKSE
jgi:ABC-type antimicrobial peptide transport system permease subunit